MLLSSWVSLARPQLWAGAYPGPRCSSAGSGAPRPGGPASGGHLGPRVVTRGLRGSPWETPGAVLVPPEPSPAEVSADPGARGRGSRWQAGRPPGCRLFSHGALTAPAAPAWRQRVLAKTRVYLPDPAASSRDSSRALRLPSRAGTSSVAHPPWGGSPCPPGEQKLLLRLGLRIS